MSLIGMGYDPDRKPGQELEQLHVAGGLEVIQSVAADIVNAGVEKGVVEPGLVAFAEGVLGEPGTEASLILPTYPLVSVHMVLAKAQNPDTRSERVYAVHLRDGQPEPRINEYVWTKAEMGHPAMYKGGGAVGHFGMSNAVMAAATKEELHAMIEWKQSQATALEQLEKNGPLGRVTALVESAFGGVPLAEPERAVRELSARLLTAALLERQHLSPAHLTSIDSNGSLLEPRLSRLFHLQHRDAFKELITKVDSVAKLSTVSGTIEADRVKALSTFLTEDTARFLEKVWPDLERMVEIERLGIDDVGKIVDILKQMRSGR